MPNGTFPIAQAEVLTSGAALSALVIVRTFLSPPALEQGRCENWQYDTMISVC